MREAAALLSGASEDEPEGEKYREAQVGMDSMEGNTLRESAKDGDIWEVLVIKRSLSSSQPLG